MSAEVVPPPAWLLRLLAKPKPTPIVAVPRNAAAGFVENILADKADQVRRACQGGRNHVLNAVAYSCGRLVASGLLDDHQVITTLTEAAEGAGLSKRETALTIASGLKAGRAA